MNIAEELVPVILDGQVIELEKSAADLLKGPPVKLSIDGQEVEIPRATLTKDPVSGELKPRLTTVLDAAQKAGVSIPVLCHREHMTPVAVCRFCAVDVGGRVLAAACHRPVEDGMKVATAATSEKVRKAVGVLTQLLLADNQVPRKANHEYGNNELRNLARGQGISPEGSPFPKSHIDRGHDESSPVIAVDHNACILCDRCVRACNEIRHNEVIGRMGKGFTSRISFDLNDPMGHSSCVSCGECMASCPTGALTSRKMIESHLTELEGAKPVSLDDICSHPLFDGISRPFMDWNRGSVVRREFQAGEIICREGESGSTAFIIEKGSLEVFIRASLQNLETKPSSGFLGLFRKFTSSLGKSDAKPKQRFFSIDAPVSLLSSNPIAELTPDDVVFGEMTCMNNYPRSATVRAKTAVTLLEIRRNVLYLLQRNNKSKEILDNVYRKRSIDTHLRSVPIFADQFTVKEDFDKFVSLIREKARLVRLNPGDIIFRQGDTPDNFYLVRIGFVKITLKQPGGDLVLNYTGPGGVVGEIALMTHLAELKGKTVSVGRTATATALDHVDLVSISGQDFRAILESFPKVRDAMVAIALERLEDIKRQQKKHQHSPLDDFLRQGLMEARSLLVLDLEKCTRCDECTKACADTHQGVTRLVREGLRFENYLIASSCRSCLDPYCMVGCPVDAIHRGQKKEMIIEDWCIGCGKCAENCPYGNINMHPFPTGETADDPDHPGRKIAVLQQKATMCDLCESVDGQPSCVYACPHDAAHRIPGLELIRLVDGRK
ncbi:MAG: cyclic nucleotide-binding domain-containing protein [Gemmataceae bacterium]|nr:cyclic nucleotide-binding domain-containing protein [Gemmataceae bacterium]